ncbi:MAG: prepilin-type N-terminal cleavage/methylation domain-containing protein [Candidatus Omnitrophica bacterium]|nr:prepilin-type N-terminal cleavage/methylation domain-containing protein [Candidatus Omnitrophota bacterium]
MSNKAGFTLVEIIVASVVFALVIAGLLSVFVAGSRHIIHVRERITSAELGKLFIDPLQTDVRQDTWTLGQASNALTLGTTYCDSVGGHTQNKDCPAPAERKVNNRDFSAKYVIENVSGTDLRLVTTTISWDELSP